MREHDESKVDFPEGYKHLEGTGVTAHKYGSATVLRGGRYGTTLLNELKERKRKNKAIMMAVVGSQGDGKTYFGITLAKILDPNFKIRDAPAPDPTEDDSQLCFTRSHLMYLLGEDSPLKRGQVIILDEAHDALGARGFQGREQIDLINHIATIRSKGFIFMFITLQTAMMDKIARDYVINYRVNMVHPGFAKVYGSYFPFFGKKAITPGKGTLKLPLPDEGLCNWTDCLTCSYVKLSKGEDRCMTIRAIYEGRKLEFVNSNAKNFEEVEPTKPEHLDRDLLYILAKNNLDKIPVYSNNINNSKMPTFFASLGIEDVSRDTTREIVYRLIDEKLWTPELKEKP